MHGLIPRTRFYDVTVTRRGSRRIALADDELLRVHSSTNLPPDDVVVIDGIPVTSVARSLLGVAALVPHEVSQDELVDVVAGAIETRAATMTWLRWLLAERRCRGRDGVSALEDALDARERQGPTESWLERRMQSLLAEAGLPRPVLQRTIPRGPGRVARVDFAYERQRIVIEVLGYAFHRTPEQMSDDTMRANEIQLRRYIVIQLTARTLQLEPARAVDVVARALEGEPPSTVLGP
jgi:very-short-patch-repair endonuclease